MKTATLLSVLALGFTAAAAPAAAPGDAVPDTYDPAIPPVVPDYDGDWDPTIWKPLGPPKIVLPKGYGAPPPAWPPAPVDPNYGPHYAKRDASPEAHAGAWGPPPPQPWGPPPAWPPAPPPVIPVFPPAPAPPAPQVCSGNNAIAACCNGGACDAADHGIISGLLGLGLTANALNSACGANQQINCCTQNGGGLINIQSCGSLLDLL